MKLVSYAVLEGWATGLISDDATRTGVAAIHAAARTTQLAADARTMQDFGRSIMGRLSE